MEDNLITIAIRRQEQAEILCKLLEQHDIKAVINEINKDHARVGDGVRVRIHESDLVKALAVIEQQQELDLENIESQEPVQNILIPYDFTLHSHNACMIGFKLAKLMNAKITIIHAYFVTTALYEISTSSMFEPNLYKNISLINDKFKELKHELEELIANEKLPNIPFNFISAEGLPEDVINDYCKKNRPQLVIMGTRNRHKKENEVIGSVTAEVIESCPSPVFIIPENSEVNFNIDPINILFATNFDERTLNTIERMMIILKHLPINIYFTHFEQTAKTWNEVKLSGIKNYFTKHYPNIPNEYKVISGGEILDELQKQTELLNINIVVINTHKRNLFIKLFTPSIARKMVLNSNIPVIVFHS